MTEQQIQKKIIEAWEKKGAWVLKYNAGPYGKKSQPDLFISFPMSPHPAAIFNEVKKPGKDADKYQKVVIARMRFEGNLVAVVHSVEESFAYARSKGIPV